VTVEIYFIKNSVEIIWCDNHKTQVVDGFISYIVHIEFEGTVST